METHATEPHSLKHNIELAHHSTGRASPKFNKYVAIIIILAIIAAAVFYFKPAAQQPSPNVTEQAKIILPTENITPEIPQKLQFTEDLKLWGLNIPSSLGEGSPFSISFNLNNTGNASMKSVLVTAAIDNTSVYNTTLTDFDVNASEVLGFTLLSKDANYPTVGSHLLNIFGNNYSLYSIGFEITPRIFAPDLSIRGFVVRPEFGVTVGKDVSVIVYVRNIGNVDASNASIKISAGDTLLLDNSFDLPMKTTKTFEASWIPSQAGTYFVHVVTYASGEVYTDDNNYGFNVTVANSTI